MTRITLSKLILATLCAMVTGISAYAQELKDQRDTLSWALGESYARQCLNDNLQLDRGLMLEAFIHTMNGNAPLLDDKSYEMAVNMVQYLQYARNKKIQEAQQKAAEQLEQTLFTKLMEENPQIKKSDDGFYYEVIQQGKGRKAMEHYRITFDYKGYNMLTGELFDQTYGSNPRLTIVLDNSIFFGLHKGLQMMREGDIYRFYFPNQLAFGSKGSKDLPPYTAVIFEVELHQVHLD